MNRPFPLVYPAIKLRHHSKGVPMEPLRQNAISIKTSTGNLGFGSLEWVVRDAIQLMADLTVTTDTECELRMELFGLPRSILLNAAVTDVWPAEDGASHIRMKLSSEATEDRKRLERWLKDQAHGGTSVDPASWTQDLSGVHSRRGRKTVTSAFRERRSGRRALSVPTIDIPLDEIAAELESK